MRLFEKVRTGDVIGIASLLSNRFFNFLKLWIIRDFQYAKKNWEQLIPKKFYIVCKARGTDLIYAAEAKKKGRQADIRFCSLGKIGRIVYVGRAPEFKALKAQQDLNENLINLHYHFTAGYEAGMAEDMFDTRSISNSWLNRKFMIYATTIGGVNWHNMFTVPGFKPSCLNLIEMGNFERV